MRTELKRALVTAILATVILAGCGPRPETFPAETPQELKQLTEVTDRIAALARSLEEGAESSSTRDAIRQSIAAVAAARPVYKRHSDAILDLTNAAVLACIDSHSIELMDLETLLARFDEAVQRQDEVKAQGRKSLLQMMAMNASGCAAQSSVLLIDGKKRREALEHGALLISEIYAISATMRAASGLSLGVLLKDQIRIYEGIVAKLGPKHAVPVLTDALPKLRAAVAMLEKSGSGVVKPELPASGL